MLFWLARKGLAVTRFIIYYTYNEAKKIKNEFSSM